jgi:hypothetical protein
MESKRFIAIMTSEEFTEGEKFMAIGQYQTSSFGGFQLALWNVFCVADDSNVRKLGLGFPSHAAAFLEWRRGDLQDRFEAFEVAV